MEHKVEFPLIQFPAGVPPVACVDIGGTKVSVNVADAHGIRGKVAEPTAKQGSHDALAQQVIRLVGQSCAAAGLAVADIGAVGVATCGPFVMRDGLIELAAPNICGGLQGDTSALPNDWQTALLEAPLRAVFPNVRVENDGVGALEAERRWGALQGLDDCAYVTWSTGVGMGLCVGGRVLRGKNGNAGHGGHSFVSDDSQALCGCGNVGDVEGLVGGNSIARRFAAQGYASAAILFEAARAGDTRAEGIIGELCRVMGRALYNLIVTLDLQAISLGGSVFWHHREYLLPLLRRHTEGGMRSLSSGVRIVPAGLGNRVGDFAALALVI